MKLTKEESELLSQTLNYANENIFHPDARPQTNFQYYGDGIYVPPERNPAGIMEAARCQAKLIQDYLDFKVNCEAFLEKIKKHE